jgi:hypothetical protein
VRFETTRDDLDDLEAAVIRGAGGRQFALVRHHHQPQPGTDILINERSRDMEADLRHVLHVLESGVHELRWMHPKIQPASLETCAATKEEPKTKGHFRSRAKAAATRPTALAEKIKALLQTEGTSGISVAEIAAKLKIPRRAVSTWFAASGAQPKRATKGGSLQKKAKC